MSPTFIGSLLSLYAFTLGIIDTWYLHIPLFIPVGW